MSLITEEKSNEMDQKGIVIHKQNKRETTVTSMREKKLFREY